MAEPEPHPRLTRRRLLGAAGGTMVGLTALAGGGGTTDDARASSQEDSPTPTPTPTATPVPSVEWPVYQFDSRNSGYSPTDIGPRDAVGARWSHAGGGAYTTTPLVSQSSIYAADEGAGVVRAIDRETGAQRWETRLELTNSRFVVQGDTVYVPSAQPGAELQALDVADGSRRWQVEIGNQTNSLVATDSVIWVGSRAGLYSVSNLSRSIRWHYDGVRVIDSGIAYDGDNLFAADSQNGKTVQIDTAGGSENWTRFLESPALDAPTVADGLVFVPTEGALYALDKGRGTVQWRYDATVGGSVVVGDGVVYGTTTDGVAFALESSDGAVRWRTDAVGGSNAPVLAGGLLYVTDPGGRIVALDSSTGGTAWSGSLGTGVAANPSVAGSELYLGDQAGRLWALSSSADTKLGSPTPTSTATATEGQDSTPTDTPTAAGGGGTDSPTSIDLDDDDSTPGDDTPAGSTPGDDTPGGGDGGGLDLGLVSAGAAAVVALLGGGLWWRNRQSDEYDPLG